MQFRDRIAWINPFHAEHETIRTDLAPADCLRVLRESMVSRYSFRTWFHARVEWPVIGGVSGATFWMQRIHTFVRPWSLQQASGVVEPVASGSAIRVRVGMKRGNAIIHIISGALILLAGAAAALLSPNTLATWAPALLASWPLAAVFLYAIDRVWWAGDAAYLRAFISEVVATRQRRWHPYASMKRS